MRLKRRFCLILCLLAALAVLPASALPRLPAHAGAVTDAADVLSAQTAADFSAYASEVEAETGLRLQVALVHFLDGLDARAYAEALFSAWGLGDDDILLCGAAGEDAFAAVMGDGAAAVLGFKSADNLLYTSSGFAGPLRLPALRRGAGRLLPRLSGAADQADGRGDRHGRSVRGRCGHARANRRVRIVGRGHGRHRRRQPGTTRRTATAAVMPRRA